MKEKLERIVKFFPAWDKRSDDPKKNYGIHGVEMKFLLKGDKGTIQFVVFTHWQLPHVQKETDSRPIDMRFPYLLHKPMPADIGYHSPKPMYEGQEPMSGKCEYVEGGKCYYDGSSLRAEQVFNILCEKGSDGVWEYMEQEYKERFINVDRTA